MHVTGNSKYIHQLEAYQGSKRLLILAIWLSALTLIISANTFFGQLEGMASLSLLTLIAASLFIIVRSYTQAQLTSRYLKLCKRWAVCVLLPYVIISLYSLSIGGMGTLLFFVFLSIAPLLIKSLTSQGLIGYYFKTYITVIVFFAVISLFLWLVGPIANIVAPNMTIENNWSVSGETLETPGWYGLLYAIQPIDIFGVTIHRNTGIFVEAPMYSFTLCLAFALELLCYKKPRVSVISLLVLTIVTTFSITGYIFVGLVVVCKIIHWAFEQKRFKKYVKPVCIIGTIFIIAVLVFLLQGKMGTPSGNTRLDDFIAGFLAWSNNFVLGNGLNGYNSIVERMSEFRLHNTGFSNSPLFILAEGGIVLALPYIIGIVAIFRLRPFNLRLFSLSFLLLWVITVVPFIAVTALVFALALAPQIENESLIFRDFKA